MAPGAGHRIVTAIMDLCLAHSIPKPDRLARSALGQQVQNLLAGGYDERDVRDTALELAARFTMYERHKALMTLQNTVTQRYEDARYADHDSVKRGSSIIAPDVIGAMGTPLKAITGAHSPYDPMWRRRCAADGCVRTALFGLERCGAHEPENEIAMVGEEGNPTTAIDVPPERSGERT